MFLINLYVVLNNNETKLIERELSPLNTLSAFFVRHYSRLNLFFLQFLNSPHFFITSGGDKRVNYSVNSSRNRPSQSVLLSTPINRVSTMPLSTPTTSFVRILIHTYSFQNFLRKFYYFRIMFCRGTKPNELMAVECWNCHPLSDAEKSRPLFSKTGRNLFSSIYLIRP